MRLPACECMIILVCVLVFVTKTNKIARNVGLFIENVTIIIVKLLIRTRFVSKCPCLC